MLDDIALWSVFMVDEATALKQGGLANEYWRTAVIFISHPSKKPFVSVIRLAETDMEMRSTPIGLIKVDLERA